MVSMTVNPGPADHRRALAERNLAAILVLTATLSGDATAQLREDDSAGLGGDDGDGGDGEHEESVVATHDAQAVVGKLSYWSGGGRASSEASRKQQTISARWRLAKMPMISST